MILTNFTLYMRLANKSNEEIDYSYTFFKKTRHIANYVERMCLKKIRFEANGFKNILIELREAESMVPTITSNKSLQIPILFDRSEYDKISSLAEFREFVIKTIVKAFQVTKGVFTIPAIEILDSIEELKSKNNYVNQWLHQRKVDSKRKIVVELTCSLTVDRFALRLVVLINDEEEFNKIVLETDPDEVAFHYRFKDIIIESKKITISSKTSENLLEYVLKTNDVIMYT